MRGVFILEAPLVLQLSWCVLMSLRGNKLPYTWASVSHFISPSSGVVVCKVNVGTESRFQNVMCDSSIHPVQ